MMQKNHWEAELLAQLDYCAGLRLKKGNNDTKHKIIKQAFSGPDYDTNPRMIVIWFRRKLEHDNINLSEYVQTNIAQTFIANVSTLIDLMTSGTTQQIRNYINSL